MLTACSPLEVVQAAGSALHGMEREKRACFTISAVRGCHSLSCYVYIRLRRHVLRRRHDGITVTALHERGPKRYFELDSLADSFGDHQVGCGGNGDRIARHNAVRDVLYNAAQSAALAPTKDAPSLVPGSYTRTADILLPNWTNGRPAALDVSVISSMQQLTLVEAASSPSHAVSVGIRRKLTANLPACQAAGVMDFLPIVVETLGGWCPDSIATIRSIGRTLGERLISTDPVDMTNLFGRLVIALQRGNASLWIHRHPTFPPLVDGLI